MKTAITLLFEKLDRVGDQAFLTYLKVNRQNILELEREQIKKANLDGYMEARKYNSSSDKVITTEAYYEENYGQAGRAFTQDLISKK